MAQLWFKFWAKDYLSDSKVLRLTYERRGILQTLWAFAWEEGSIPSDPEELGMMLGIDANAMRTHCDWLATFFVSHPDDPSKLVSPRLELDRMEADKKGSKARESAFARWNKEVTSKKQSSEGNANAQQTQCVPDAGQGQGQGKDLTPTPLGQGGEKKAKRPSWQNALAPEVVKATQEIRSIWPTPQQDHYQPDSKTLVPGVSASELAMRLSEVSGQGADLGICVEIAKRAVSEWKAGKWIKAPQHFFGKAKDAPYKAYYQAHVTNQQMKALRDAS